MDETNKELPYDPSDVRSIVEHASLLVGKSLREAAGVESIDDVVTRKGSLGNAVEYYWFHYNPNSSAEADFEEAGVELKTTPVRRTKKGELVSKERLVLSMINYMDVIDETWETSAVLRKSERILLLSYLYEPHVDPVDYEFCLAELWSIPEEDMAVIRHDWETVVGKVREGRAHEISGGDTLYLEACTKAANSSVRRPQPFSDVPAKPRAWALKASYMTAVTQRLLSNARGIVRGEGEGDLSLLELVRARFSQYAGRTEAELAKMFGLLKENGNKPKNLCALITRRILGVDGDNEIAEFAKAGIKPKTMRLKCNGIPKESVSFPCFDYFDLAERDFEDSDFLIYLEQKYLFVIYREDPGERGVYRLDDVMFWQMPEYDIPEARRCYEEMQRRVREGRADESVGIAENRCCHVRPHGRNAADVGMTPYGVPVAKKCFWLNARYVGDEVRRLIESAS